MARLMNSTGNIVDIFNLKKEDISSDVIILGAYRINRFLGQTAYAYPVAAHLIGGYWYLESIGASDTLKKQWLIHEAFESYSGVDLPSPLKAMLPQYKEAEIEALKIIAEAFGVNPAESDEIKALDRAIMVAEALELMPNKEYWNEFAKENNITPLDSKYVISREFCYEEHLQKTLTDIWDKVFGSQDLVANTKNYSIGIFPDENRGWFEHYKWGDEQGGGLLFNEDKELVDYDGISSDLPLEIVEAIEKLGYKVDESFYIDFDEPIPDDIFEYRYKLVTRKDDSVAFETYGDDLLELKEKASAIAEKNGTKPYQHIWTVVDGDSGDLLLLNGWHLCNRINYVLCENAWGDGTENDSKIYIEAKY